MSIGLSGRIVIEVPPTTKRELYAALARDGLTLKEWFLNKAHEYTLDNAQSKLLFDEDRRREFDKATQVTGLP